MVVFILKSSACLAIFLLFYKLFLEKHRMHIFKRYYLLAVLVLALMIPSITFTEYIEAIPAPTSIAPVEYNSAETTEPIAKDTTTPEVNTTEIDYWPVALWTVYGLGVLLFSLKFFFNLWNIARNIRNNPKLKINSLINVLLRDAVVPHTFFNYVFLNRQKFEAHEIPKEVLVHEATHARQKHSLDVLFVELLQIVFWFNPLIHLTKKSIKLNHEFLADEAVLRQGSTTPDYQSILLVFASSASYKKHQPSMANAINYSSYSSIKKRFKVMKTQTSKKSILIRNLLILPLFVLVLYGFSTTVKIPKEAETNTILQEGATQMELWEFHTLADKYNAVPKEKRVIPPGDLKRLEGIYGKMVKKQKAEALPFPECPDPKSSNQEGATNMQVADYNYLAKRFNAMLASNRNIRIKKADINRLEYLHGIMTQDQRANAETFPDFPEPPAPPVPPSSPDKSEREAAEEIVQYIIENQDPYDNVRGNMRLSRDHNGKKKHFPQKDHSMIRTVEEVKNKNEVIQETNASKQTLKTKPSRHIASEKEKQHTKLEQSLSLPPAAPMIARHVNTDNYSEALKKSIDTYLAERKMYNEAFSLFMEKQKGSVEDLRNKYNQMMGVYHNYAALAHKEGKFMQPVPFLQTRESRVNTNTPPAPPAPPKPKSPLELLKELKKDNVKIILDGKEIDYEEAEKLFEENTFSRVNVRKNTGGRTVLEVSTE